MQYLSVMCLPASQFGFHTLACTVPLHWDLLEDEVLYKNEKNSSSLVLLGCCKRSLSLKYTYLCCSYHRCRNRRGRSGHGLTTLLTWYFKAKSRVQQAMSLSHSLLAYAITHVIAISTSCVYCRASSEMCDAAVAVLPNCSSTQHSKITHSLHKHLTWPLQFCFLCLWLQLHAYFWR